MSAVIQTKGLTKRYGSTLALDRLDLEVNGGEVFGFLGPNGAGKTTTIRLLLGVIRATAGSARLFGHDAWHDAVEVHRRLAYVPSELSLWPSLTGRETLDFLGYLHGGVDARYRDELIDRFGLDPTIRVRAYSRGNRQKVGVIAAFMLRPKLLILDEPTTGLDPLMEMAFRECVREAREHGQAVFLSSHVLSEVEAVCDRVAILRKGRLVELRPLAELRQLAAHTVETLFAGPAPPLSGIPGVEALSLADGRLRCEVHGSMQPLLAALGDAQVTSLVSREASLEEIFLAYYGNDEAR